MDWSTIIEHTQSGNAVLMSAVLTLSLVACLRLARRKSPNTYKRGAVLLDGRQCSAAQPA
jgi:hypothetical protein